jgi:hypothetical protein
VNRLRDVTGHLRISVVIPSWRDTENLASLLPALAAKERIAETIVVDASGDEQAEQIALGFGATFITASKPNRGEQMNLGAAASRGDVIVAMPAWTKAISKRSRACWPIRRSSVAPSSGNSTAAIRG